MKKLVALLVTAVVVITAYSQVPEKMSYQAVVRNTSGDLVRNHLVGIRITIAPQAKGISYAETHTVMSNNNGLITLEIGGGTVVIGNFSTINWADGPYDLKTEIDPDGGTNYTISGTSPMLTVPYAEYAKKAASYNETDPVFSVSPSSGITGSNITNWNTAYGWGNHAGLYRLAGWVPAWTDITGKPAFATVATSGSYNDLLNKPSIINSQWTTSGSNIYYNSGNVGIGTTTPVEKLHVAGNTRLNNSMVGDGIELMAYATGNRFAGIDFHGDDTYTDYALRIIRYNSGPNAISQIEHHGTGILNLQTDDAADIAFTTNMAERMRIMGTGNVGIGTASPAYTLDIKGRGRLIGNSPNSAGLWYSNLAGTLNRAFAGMNDDNTIGFYGVPIASFGLVMNVNNGNVGIGTPNPTSKFVVQPDAAWDDNTPLFEVKNKTGVPIFAVYNNGVRILVDHTISKAVKGGFAVGGYDMTKAGKTVDFMTISPDSIRFNINNDNVKGLKGGFAVGGYDITKGPINQDFMYITPQTSNNGQYNTFLGYTSGHSMTTGKENVILGVGAGYFNNTGSQNVFVGKSAGQYNRSGSKNIIMGWSDYVAYPFLDPGNLGSNNTLIGYSTGLTVVGNGNTTLGYRSGSNLGTGTENTLIGSTAGNKVTSGNYNVFVGTQSGENNTTGTENVFIGGAAGWNHTTGSNNVALGTDAQVPYPTGSNQIRIGDTRMTYAGIQVAWTVTSDIKWKESIEDLALGLNMVKGLRPVDYIRKNNSSGTREAGFIAQDVQKLFSEMGIKNSGLLSSGADGSLELRYNDFIPILTKAIQEQQLQIESQNQKIDRLERLVEQLMAEK